jgi:hypothetical protein
MNTEEQLKALVRDFFAVLDIVEESDSGRIFHPTYISSSRTMDAIRLDKILKQMKEFTKE